MGRKPTYQELEARVSELERLTTNPHLIDARQRLEESEQRYKSLFENNHAVMLIIDPETADIVDANPAALSFYGWDYQTILDKKITDINVLSPQQVRHEMEQAQKAKRNHFYFKHRLADNSIRHVEVYSGPIVFSGKRFLYSIVHDITERKKLEQQLNNYQIKLEGMIAERTTALELSKARFKNIYSHMSNGVAVYRAIDNGRDFQFIDINPAVERIENVKAGDLLGKRITQIFPGVEDFGFLDVLRQVWQTGKPMHHPVNRYTDKRIQGWRENYVFKLPSGEIVTIYDDVTHQKEAEDKLKKACNFYQTVLDGVNDSLMVINRDHTIALANQSALKTAGLKRIDGLTCHEISHSSPEPCRSSDHVCPLKTVFKTGASHRVEHIHKSLDGSEIIVELTASPIFNDAGEVIQVIELSRDITASKVSQQEKKDLETRLQQNQKMEAIGTLAGGIAHDFNNILGGIMGYAQLVRNNIDNPLKASNLIEQVIIGAQRASELTRQILTFSRQAEYQKKPFRIYLEINEALKLLRSSIPSTIDIKKRLESRSIVLADPIRIHQIIMNLCTNSYHAMKKTGGCLTVSLTDSPPPRTDRSRTEDTPATTYVKLEVGDTGHGMDEGTLARAFDPYYTTKEAGEGTGLGLSLVRAIVEEHHAILEVDSTPNKGTIFSIYFPALEDTRKEKKKGADGNTSLKGSGTIMVIDDEQQIRDSFKLLLEDYGYTVCCFENGNSALESFRQTPDDFDLVITDMTMPGLTGERLAEKILEKRPELPIIMCTGFNDKASTIKAKNLGIKEVLQKPVNLENIFPLIRNLICGKPD